MVIKSSKSMDGPFSKEWLSQKASPEQVINWLTKNDSKNIRPEALEVFTSFLYVPSKNLVDSLQVLGKSFNLLYFLTATISTSRGMLVVDQSPRLGAYLLHPNGLFLRNNNRQHQHYILNAGALYLPSAITCAELESANKDFIVM